MRYVSWVVGCILALGVGLSYAGENEGATISFDLERDGEAEMGNQGNEALKDIVPGESLVLSVYADRVSNLAAYVVSVQFDTTRLSFEDGGYTNFALFERDAFAEAGLTPSTAPVTADPADRSIVALSSAALPVPAEDKAPDGDGKLLGWVKFTTLDPFEEEARFSSVSAKLKGVDESWDELSSEGVEAVAAAPIIAVELGSWGRIKATMGW